MGSFSWLRADRTTKRSNIVGGDSYKILIPKEFGGGFIKDIYYDCKMACRDQGQYHWIKEKGTENDEKKSNYYWYDKTRKKEEK